MFIKTTLIKPVTVRQIGIKLNQNSFNLLFTSSARKRNIPIIKYSHELARWSFKQGKQRGLITK